MGSRRQPIRRANPERRAATHTKTFGPKADFIRRQRCIVCATHLDIEACHVRSRGAGGTADDLVPMCRNHHLEQHAIGVRTFAARHNLDLGAEAERHEALWIAYGESGDMPL